jgi:hypothetical protein
VTQTWKLAMTLAILSPGMFLFSFECSLSTVLCLPQPISESLANNHKTVAELKENSRRELIKNIPADMIAIKGFANLCTFCCNYTRART